MLDRLDRLCADAITDYGCPSISVAVVERDEVALAAAYGSADLAGGVPATPGTAYLLASATKPLTALAVCIAADDGLIELDAPVPGDFGRAAPTVRQLLRHRGGLGAHYDFDYGDGTRRIDADRYAGLYRDPGTGFEYANLGYRIVGGLLEQATGQCLGDAVRDRVLQPLGLDRCHLGPAYPNPARAATRYTIDGRAYPDCDTSHPGATLGWSTAADLAKFAQSYERVLSPDTAAAVRDALPVNAHLGYGLGWCVSTGDGPVVQSHGGGMGGVAAMVVTVPAQQLGVAVLTNSTGKAARDAVVRYVLEELVPGYRSELISPATDDPERPPDLPEGRWAGRIDTAEGELAAGLRVLAGGRAELRLDGERATEPVSASAAWDLRATFPVQLPTADARVNSPVLGLELRRDGGGLLTGVARAYKNGDAEGWLGNLLSHPCTFEPS